MLICGYLVALGDAFAGHDVYGNDRGQLFATEEEAMNYARCRFTGCVWVVVPVRYRPDPARQG